MIRPLALRDASELTALRAANRDFLASTDPARPDDFFTLAGQGAWLRNLLALREQGLQYPFGILEKDALVGIINLSNVVRGPLQSANVGYWITRERNGRGLASRALAELSEAAFGDLGLHRLEAGTLVDNVASQRVLEKNGFERIGLARNYLLVAGRWRDHILYQRIAGV